MALALPLASPRGAVLAGCSARRRRTDRLADPGWRPTAPQGALEVALSGAGETRGSARRAAPLLVAPVRAAGRALRSVVDAVVLLVVLTFLALAVGPHLLDYRPVTMLTGSMTPAIPAGAVVLSTFVPADEIGVGDVITLQAPTEAREVVTHRVTEVARSGGAVRVTTQGDGNPLVDPWTAELEGPVLRASASLPWIGHPLSVLQRPDVTLVMTRLLPLTLIASLLWTVWRRPTRPRTPAGPDGQAA